MVLVMTILILVEKQPRIKRPTHRASRGNGKTDIEGL